MDFDVVIVGSGPGGYIAAVDAARRGLKTAIVEAQEFGGVCLNVGCIPTKTLLKSAKVYHYVCEAQKFGVELSENNKILPNWTKMQERKSAVVQKLVKAVAFLMKSNKVTVFKGLATPVNQHQLRVGSENVDFKNLIIATGSLPRKMELPGFNEARASKIMVDSTGILELSAIPKKLVIIGGGVIGLEFAFLFAELGSQVTIVEFLPTILAVLDQEISQLMAKIAQEKKIVIYTNHRVVAVKQQNLIAQDSANKIITIPFDICLEAVGRIPNLSGFDQLGLERNERGVVLTDEYCRTNIEHIYAIGDVNGKQMLAHVASAEAHAAVACLVKDPLLSNYRMNYLLVPNAIYTHPEVASVGYTEATVKKQNLDYVKFSYPLARSGKALADGETNGFVKIIAQKPHLNVLGVHIVATTATDMIGEITTLLASEGTVSEITKAIHPHPTIGETLFEAAYELNHLAKS